MTNDGAYWTVSGHYEPGLLTFGFGALRPINPEPQPGDYELRLWSLTPDEARSIADALVAGARDVEAQKGGDER